MKHLRAYNNLLLLKKSLNIKIFNCIGFEEKSQIQIIIGVRSFEQPTVSTYLRNLVKKGWILEERRGKYVYYRLNIERFKQIEKALKLV